MDIIYLEKTSFSDPAPAIVVPVPPLTVLPAPPVPVDEINALVFAQIFNTKFATVTVKTDSPLLGSVAFDVTVVCHLPDSEFTETYTTKVIVDSGIIGTKLMSFGKQVLYASVFAHLTAAVPNPAYGSVISFD